MRLETCSLVLFLIDLFDSHFIVVVQLQLSYSTNSDDQQRAAIDMAHLVEGASVFPAVSFGPISHALCKLVPSNNRTVASYSARAMKFLLLDDALRPQVC